MCVTYREGSIMLLSPVTADESKLALFQRTVRLQTHKSVNRTFDIVYTQCVSDCRLV